MVNYAHARRIRRKRRIRRIGTSRGRPKSNVNPGIAIRNDNMVWMKRLHRGPARMRYNYGNPEAKYPMNLRGVYKYAKDMRVKRGKYLRGSVKSDL